VTSVTDGLDLSRTHVSRLGKACDSNAAGFKLAGSIEPPPVVALLSDSER
jgi:hypothetical protein